MKAAPIFWLLWRRRALIALGAVLAVAAAVKLAGGSGGGAALAQSDVLLDTPSSQLVDANPARAESLPLRASLLADLLATEPARRGIAREAGIAADQLAVVNSQLTTATVPASLPRTAAEAAAQPVEPYVLTVGSDGVIPLVSITATAPDGVAAARLAEAATRVLKANAAPADIPVNAASVADRVGPIEVQELGSGGHGMPVAVAAAVIVFVVWCGVVALLPALATSVRTPTGSVPGAAG